MTDDAKQEPDETIALAIPTSFLKQTGQFSRQDNIEPEPKDKPDTLLGVVQDDKK